MLPLVSMIGFGDDDDDPPPAAAPRPFDVRLDYVFDGLANVAGGWRRDAAGIGYVDLAVETDLEELCGWTGGRLLLRGLGTHGGSISAAVGDVQAVSSIEGPNGVQLYEAWLQQDVAAALSVRAGLYDITTEFDIAPVAALFVHSGPGTGSDFGNSGRNGPATFPTTSLALRLEASVSEFLYARFVVADGVPGEPGELESTRISLGRGDGALLVGEVGYETTDDEAPVVKVALGGWGYTGRFDDFQRVDANGAPVELRGSWGVYALAEQRLFVHDDDPARGLNAFARVGLADERTSLFDGYVGGGLVYRGPFGPNEDRLGLAVAAAHTSVEYRRGVAGPAGAPDPWEVAIELTYRAQVLDWLALQPDVQLVVGPAGAPGADPALVVGVRAIVSF